MIVGVKPTGGAVFSDLEDVSVYSLSGDAGATLFVDRFGFTSEEIYAAHIKSFEALTSVHHSGAAIESSPSGSPNRFASSFPEKTCMWLGKFLRRNEIWDDVPMPTLRRDIQQRSG